METVVLNGTGPTIRLKVDSEDNSEKPKVDVAVGSSIKTVPLTDNTKLKFAS